MGERTEFDRCLKIEERMNDKHVLPFLKQKMPGMHEHCIEGRSHNGDFEVSWNRRGKNKLLTIEVKAEPKRYHRNTLFLEHWSNKGIKAGWMLTLEADRLLYVMGGDEKNTIIVWIKLKELQVWFKQVCLTANKYNIVEPKCNSRQKNQTCGYSVPLSDIVKDLGSECVQIFVKDNNLWKRRK